MTHKQTRVLLLWASALALVLLTIVPLAVGPRLVVVAAVLVIVARAWRQAKRGAPQQDELSDLAGSASLPPANYQQPVVMVCGDGLIDLFGPVPVEQLALRVTEQGCYVRVPTPERLQSIIASIKVVRPEWGAQLSVMLVFNPEEHADNAVLVNQIRAIADQVAMVRQRGIALPLLMVSYLQASQGCGSWFSWEAGQTHPRVRGSEGCLSLADWQLQAADSAAYAARLQACVQLDSAAAWLGEAVMPHLVASRFRESGSPVAWAISLVPALAQRTEGNLRQQWLRDKIALTGTEAVSPGLALPFPDAVLHVFPLSAPRSQGQRTRLTGLWLFVVASLIALTSSAWQNTLLIRQVSDDLRRYMSPAMNVERPAFVLQEEALAVLRQDASRLDLYYRHGAPWSLGLGLYRGERVRLPLLATIASHRQPPVAPVPAAPSKSVRLDSLSLFSTGSAQLKPDSTKVLINALVDIKAQPGWLIVISGHTDATGSAEHNLQLSRARAAAVHDWMLRMGGIPDSCFAVQGFGASQPIASNDTEHGRSANRRVEIRLVPEAGACMPSIAESDLQPLSHSAAFIF
ncbi:OmpA family protein [Pseudomonas huaxiensis]|uniref:OmpA family protein n=1 Tax=Pseudomonas huaxiensis TaxID=2213017 RepID=UPI000DA66016|nr:OmpA family protein [Pseudomonas huaxiensis]